MAIISESNNKTIRRYQTSQFRYAITYVVITFGVLLFLNIYCSKTCEQLFYQSKDAAMVEKCQLASDEISTLDVLNPSTVSGIVEQMGSLKVSRLIVTDQTGLGLYDSDNTALGSYVLLPEVIQALGCNDVFFWQFRDGAMISRAATPIVYHGNVIGCVYMADYDTELGALFRLLQRTILQITLILELVLLIFSLVYSGRFSRRIRKIMHSMRIIQQGDYSHKVAVGGNDELTVLGSEFNDLTDRLQTSEEKRRRFVSDASHELKTPLASIKLLSDSILQNEMDPETTREFVGDIGNEADRLTRMTGKLLSLTRVDGEIPQETELIYLSPTILRVSRMLAPLAENAGIEIRLDLEPDSTVLILEDDLYQIVFNLMENGIKYSSDGGILTVRLDRKEDTAFLTVQDTGIGIDQDAIGHIFERFYRVDKARSRATGGSGLGLAIVKTIVQRNRGEISVESTPGKGTCFTVTFPVFDAEVDKE